MFRHGDKNSLQSQNYGQIECFSPKCVVDDRRPKWFVYMHRITSSKVKRNGSIIFLFFNIGFEFEDCLSAVSRFGLFKSNEAPIVMMLGVMNWSLHVRKWLMILLMPTNLVHIILSHLISLVHPPSRNAPDLLKHPTEIKLLHHSKFVVHSFGSHSDWVVWLP